MPGSDPWADRLAPGAPGSGGGQPGPGYGAPQPSGGYGAGGYGAAGHPGYGPARTTSANAIVALVLAILSFPVCPVIFAIIALVLAKSADREIAESHGTKEGTGLVRAARIIGWINIGLFGLLLVIAVAATLIAGLAGVSRPRG
jgi:hypothetical protein